MNLHEECLLKYLLNPLNLAESTELLKYNNQIIEKSVSGGTRVSKHKKIKYNTNRI